MCVNMCLCLCKTTGPRSRFFLPSNIDFSFECNVSEVMKMFYTWFPVNDHVTLDNSIY